MQQKDYCKRSFSDICPYQEKRCQINNLNDKEQEKEPTKHYVRRR